jgi:hypothetical protein
MVVEYIEAPNGCTECQKMDAEQGLYQAEGDGEDSFPHGEISFCPGKLALFNACINFDPSAT